VRAYRAERVRPWVFGVARTLLGIAAGVGYIFAAERAGLVRSELGFYVGLLPVRCGEWLLVLYLFFERARQDRSRLWPRTALGIAWSYVLDLPAIAAMAWIPGGFWAC